MLKLKILQVGVVSLVKIMTVLYAMFGLIFGLFVSLSKLFGVALQGEAGQLQSMGVAAVLVLPLIYAVIGAVSGLVSALFFNLAAKWVGPVEIVVRENRE